MATLEIRALAQDDIDSASAGYYAQDPRLVPRFLQALDVAFARIQDAPERFPFVQAPVRRVMLRKFPYSIYYVFESQKVGVLAVLHHRRSPKHWKRRVTKAV